METLKRFLVSMGPMLSAKLNASYQPPLLNRFKNSFVLRQTDRHEVAEILREVKNKKSNGPDGISHEKLKCRFSVLEFFIASACNQCLPERTCSAILKTANFFPLH